MHASFCCRNCDRPQRVELTGSLRQIACADCGQTTRVPEGAIHNDCLERCLICPSSDLFVKKDFPQRLGLGIVIAGIVGSSIAWWYHLPLAAYAVLFATVLIDFVLYLFVGDALMCYRCGAIYRGVDAMHEHGHFNLETHERYRQEAARLKGSSS